MRHHTVLGAILGSLLGAMPATAGDLTLAEEGKSAYRIVVADDASASTRHGAEELQKFLAEITGATLPIVSAGEPMTEKEIILGENAHLEKLAAAIDFAALGREGYVLRTVGNHLVIAGGAQRGNLYGVYGLLEDHLGCRWFAPGVSRIPKQSRLVLKTLDERQVPVLEYREPFTFDCFDGDWCARNRMNSSAARLDAPHGGKIQFGPGFFCHTFNGLVPPDQYFDTHPEYFSLVDGKRLKDQTQLCCTNEAVIQLCIEGIRNAMRAHPESFVFSVSQNDCFNYCQCEKCQALAQQEDTQMAPVLHLVNRVAEAVEKDFPDQVVETLAYQWTRRPPKQMRPRPNVVVRLCSIECCFAHPLGTCDHPDNRKFREDLERWARVCNRLWIWDYVTDFANYLLPFPNQRVRNDNIQLFVRNNVKGIFEQDTYETPHSELASLGGYLTAKFLWNPHYDEDVALREFLEAYYGAAAAPIRRYLDLLHDHAEKENTHVMIGANPDSPHLSDALLVEADPLWEAAEAAVAEQPEVLARVKLSRMSVDFAIVERARVQAAASKPGAPPLGPMAARRFRPFVEQLASSGLTQLREGQKLNLADYRAKLAAALGLEP